MANWIETKITYAKPQTDGTLKKVTESYLVDAMSFTEAEAKIIKEMEPYISGTFEVRAVKKTKISEVIREEHPFDAKFYAVKWNIISLDEKSGEDKKIPCLALVEAVGVRSALTRFDKEMDGSNLEYEVASISETPILDIYLNDGN